MAGEWGDAALTSRRSYFGTYAQLSTLRPTFHFLPNTFNFLRLSILVLGFRRFIPDLHADFLGCAHCVEHAAHNLRRTRSARFISRFLLQELGMREDNAELIVQLVKKLTKFSWLFHGAPLEQICN